MEEGAEIGSSADKERFGLIVCISYKLNGVAMHCFIVSSISSVNFLPFLCCFTTNISTIWSIICCFYHDIT
ncbi:hypothetical protein RhiirA1_155565 [Rhizophagus irregularis]|uniref:Uncharacterized protein n=1 Tax=Rhizophagus irregularis TaxID=588596 RepID=A0A2N0RX83_9GLOM|nr:hypothetical protein RhiirA1_155565 [Rhizophagus irregularis]